MLEKKWSSTDTVLNRYGTGNEKHDKQELSVPVFQFKDCMWKRLPFQYKLTTGYK